MHSTNSSADMGVNNVPAFLMKIWALVEDSSTDELIAWDASGLSFHVFDQARFAKEILPFCFKHNNMASFIRQLNMYGFRKVVHIDSGAIKQEIDDVEFQHAFFVRGQECLLENIKRKTSGTAAAAVTVKPETPGVKLHPEQVSTVLNDVSMIKSKQDNMNTKMDKMKKENEALWREIASLRQKHMKQQQIVNKLIQFMVHLVGGKRGLSTTSLPKRKMPLMISDAPSQLTASKRPRYSKQLSIEELDEMPYIIKSPSEYEDTAGTSGPIIHEVLETSPDPLSTAGYTSSNNSYVTVSPSLSPAPPQNNGGILTHYDIPQASSSAVETVKKPQELSLDSSLDSTDLNNLLAVSMATSVPTETISVNGLTGQLDTMQDEIDSLKDLLSGGQYNFDPNTMFQIHDGVEFDEFRACLLEPNKSLGGNLFTAEDSGTGGIDNLLKEFEKEESASTSTSKPTTSTSGISQMPNIDPNSIIGNELVQFHTPDNLFHAVPDLSDYINDDTLQNTEEIDPMSFINTDLNTPKPQD